ncbi:alpha-2-macroglobulin family protein [Nibrella saemangeumensis]|uniref:Alpha-2-macroglobulin family protein n=1 Tax=Nibrella saemangeumensis TaxID=1084526 RepID=A0ABP8NJH3_9BACT
MNSHRILKASLALAVSGLLFWHCARLSNTVSVVGRNFEDEVQRTQNLTFTFNKNLVPESRLNEWDSVQYVRFKPAVRGKFRWVAPNEVVFSPAVAFDPATSYRAELTDALLNREEHKDLSVSGDEIAFHTPYLQLTSTESWWSRSPESGQPVAKVRLNFNYSVNAPEVGGKLALSAEGKALPAQVVVGGETSSVDFTVTNAPAERNEQPLTVRVDKGVKVLNTSYQTSEALEQSASLPSRYRVEVVDVQTGFEQNQGYVRVITTQELQPENVNQYYSLQPQVNTTAELTKNGFIIRGTFSETDNYVLTLTDQIRGVLNTRLEEPVSRDLFFGKMPASIRFATKKALYLSSKGPRNIGLNIVNVPQVQVKIAKVYENNLLHYLRLGRFEEYTQRGEEWVPSGNFVYNDDDQNQFSDILVNKTIATNDLPKVRGVSALNVALPNQPGGQRGVYVVTVGSKESAYLNASQLVSVSDIGLITRQTADDVLVFANSIRTAEPLSDVEVTLVSTNNQSVATAKTDGKGLARFEKVSEKAPGFKIAMLTARTNEDFNFLSLPDSRIETSRFDVEGKRDNASGFEAFIYGDRNIYRPGETIHFNTIVRTQQWQSVGEIPLTIRVLMPNGREYRALRKTTNTEGAVATDIALDPAAVTGTYTIEVLNANETLLASQPVSVEEFIPDRIKVDVLTDRTSYQTGQTITLSATAQNLFGPPAADRTYEMELQLKQKAFVPKGFEEYVFDIPNETVFQKDLRQGKTNANGQATERFQLPATYQDIGLLEGKLFVTVFDENGRPVNRLRRMDILTQETFFGVRLADRYVSTNVPLSVELVALDKDGKPRPDATATVEVVRYEYQTVIEKQYDQYRYTTKRREKPVYSNTLTFRSDKNRPGLASFRYVPTVSGEYEIRVRRSRPGEESGTGYTAVPFYAYGYGSTQASSFEVSSEGQVLMEFDKPAYTTGDKVKVLFKAPFNGKLLVTVERNRVQEHYWLTTDNKSAEWSFSVKDEHLPNVYVTATLIRPMDNTNLPLTVAHGFAPVPVSDTDTKLPVAITAATQSRSKTKQTIRVKTKPNTQVTLAVVDEGILQIKNFQTPDIHGFFYQKRALEVGSHDLYALLFPELSLASTSSVGGDGYDLQRRVNPLSNGRVNLVSFWSGVLTTGGNGEAEFTVDIPQFSGGLRVMAVAYKGNAFGSAAASMKVADPIVISTGLPRFLSPGDEVELPVNLSNTTNKPAPVTATLSLTGPLSADSLTSRSLTIQPGRETRAVFRVKAQQAIGPGSVLITVNGLGERFTEKTDITVRPAASLQKTTVAGSVAAGRSQAINLAGGFLPGTGRSSLVVSRSPVAQFGRELSYLLGYPHGCLEQTISKALPQIYFADLARNVGSGTVYFVRAGESDLNPSTNVRQAIQKIESMQLHHGGFSMWPGTTVTTVVRGGNRVEVNTPEEIWISAYAVHFLTEARQAGYEVRNAVFSKAIDYLTSRTSNPATEEEMRFDEAGGRTVRKVASRSNLYGLYVLSLAGVPNRPAMNYYKQNSNLLTPDSRYLLASAFYRIVDTRSYQALLPKQYADNTGRRQTGGSLASPLRNLALTLHTLVDTDPDNLQIPTLARQLSTALRQTQYINTQEAAFAFLALGKLAHKTVAGTVTATLIQNGKALGTFTGADLRLNRLATGAAVTLNAQGSGSVYYFGQSEGVPASGKIPEQDNGLRVRRTYLSRDGQPLSSVRQNDLVVVKITLTSTSGLTVDNVVITDLLPAGFEIENPRLTEPRDMPWIQKPTKPEHFDVRDDRINFYTDADGSERTFYYLVRAVSKGNFVVGLVSADAMYNPELRSYNGAGALRVN